MTKIDVISGFLGAGKTTLIKKLIKEAYAGEKVVLIENEFGEIGIDGGFLEDAGIKINELNSGCICCSLVGDFAKALNAVYEEYAPDRIVIEPSGVGKLSDVVKAVLGAGLPDCKINCLVAVVDANRCKAYMRNFGEFFIDQIASANCIVFSHADTVSEEKLQTAVELVSEKNAEATFITTPFLTLDGKDLLSVMEGDDSFEDMLEELMREHHEHAHHDCDCGHHHDHHDENCTCGCGGHHHEHERHHEHGEGCCCGHHHEEEHDHDCACHGEHHDHHHEHHHEHSEGCCCGHHHDHHEHEHHECDCGHDHHHDHGHHHADEVFASWGVETVKKFDVNALKDALDKLSQEDKYGVILRAKGIVQAESGVWIHFDYVPGEADVREGAPSHTGRLCVIGSGINQDALATLFGV